MTIQHILNLLRSGALEQAEKEYLRLGLASDTSCEDAMALGGRILKARMLEQSGADRKSLSLEAAGKYRQAFESTNGSYSGINTAALFLVAGDGHQAREMAQKVLHLLTRQAAAPGDEAYYHIATIAEAHLILGALDKAKAALRDALPLAPHDFDAHASTLKQFKMLLDAIGGAADWLDEFRPPKVAHFAGHIFGLGDSAAALEPTVVKSIRNALNQLVKAEEIGAAYGALAAGSDILIAELLLEEGVDLHAVQPCPDELFRSVSLDQYGPGWPSRFEACLGSAKSIRYVSKDRSLCDNLTKSFASETAMGLAVLHAEQYATDALQLLVWDGKATGREAGTARDAHIWSAAGRRQLVAPFPVPRRVTQNGSHAANAVPRALRAILFADVHGYGGLTEQQIPIFHREVFTRLSDSCKLTGVELSHVNTWGDALFLVLNDVESAAKAAISMQHCMQHIDLLCVGLPDSLALRIGCHYGPLHLLKDPFLGSSAMMGREVTVAARIEPLTEPGSIFVSEPFACALAISSQTDYRCEPIPDPKTTKDQGELKLFSLRPKLASD